MAMDNKPKTFIGNEKRTEDLCMGMMSSFFITHTLPARSPEARLRPLGLKATPQHVMS